MAIAQTVPARSKRSAIEDTIRKWKAIGTSCEPADREAAEHYLALAYRMAGLTPPRRVIWFDSPLKACLAAERQSRVSSPLWREIATCFKDRARTLALAHIPLQQWDAIWESIDSTLYRPLWDGWRRCLIESIDRELEMTAEGVAAYQTRLCGGGQWDAAWLAVYDYCATHYRLGDLSQLIQHLVGLADSAGFWWAFEDTAIVCERPREIHLNEHGWPHRENGPAIVYRDGWSACAWFGVGVSRETIERPDRVTVHQLGGEPNATRRNAMLDRPGVLRFGTAPQPICKQPPQPPVYSNR